MIGAHLAPTDGSTVSIPPPAPAHPDPAPQPGGLDDATRAWGAAAHLSAFLGAWLLGLAFLGPLTVYLLGRHRHPSVAFHAREALNFNLTVLLVAVVGTIGGAFVAVVTLGLGLLALVPAAIVVALGWLILVIVAGVRAWDGEAYRYPFSIRFVR